MIRVAIAGIGNCAAMLVQGIEYYKSRSDYEGIITPYIGNYRIDDIQIVAAFDVSKKKVGKKLYDAILEPPNLVKKFVPLKKSNVTVSLGPILDGVAKHMVNIIEPIETGTLVEVTNVLKKSNAEILINLLPVGSQKATEAYATAALTAHCAFINAIPVFVTSNKNNNYEDKFINAGLPLVGDDMKGQLGATTLHRTLAALCRDRGITIKDSYQLNIGGNTDFLNMLDEGRLESKRISKTEAVKSVISEKQNLKNEFLRIGPSDYVEFLGNKKIAYIHINGKGFASQPVSIEVKLEVEDKMNSSAVLVDVIRATKIALDRGESGPIDWISAFYFKHPHKQAKDEVEAFQWFNEHIK